MNTPYMHTRTCVCKSSGVGMYTRVDVGACMKTSWYNGYPPKLSSQLRGTFNKFPDFFCTAIYNSRRLLRIHCVIAVHLMR